jgi:dTMP kinase
MKLPENFRSGRLIMFDGGDGVGKSEQQKLAAQAVEALGVPVHSSRAHGGTVIGEALRKVSLSPDLPRTAYTDLLLSQTMHAQLAHEINQRRNQGISEFVDRGPGAMWSYQVRASRLSADIARPIIEADFKLFDPDLLIIYTASRAILAARLANRKDKKPDYFEDQPESFHVQVAEGYREVAEMFGGVIIDASGTIEEVHRSTMGLILPLFIAKDQI